jgi:adenylate kinase
MKPDIIFMTGPQGSGKGTQSRILAPKLGFYYWEMGAILRQNLDWRLKSGPTVGELINEGHLLSDDQIMEVFYKRFPQVPKGQGILFDGLPRRIGQARELLTFLRKQGRGPFATVYLDLDADHSMERLLKRVEIEGRPDDTPEKISFRLRQFEESTRPMFDYLKKETEYLEIDGRPDVDAVAVSVAAALGIK